MLGVLQEGMPGVQKDEALRLKTIYVGCGFDSIHQLLTGWRQI